MLSKAVAVALHRTHVHARRPLLENNVLQACGGSFEGIVLLTITLFIIFSGTLLVTLNLRLCILCHDVTHLRAARSETLTYPSADHFYLECWYSNSLVVVQTCWSRESTTGWTHLDS